MVCVRVAARREGEALSDFSVFLRAEDGRLAEYVFAYMEHPAKPSLGFGEGANDPAHCRFYRICEAYLCRLSGEEPVRELRVLQRGEVGLALREVGAGDFVGGFHGDEVILSVSLRGDGREIALDTPSFGCYREVHFSEHSQINRCNTPGELLCRHEQEYVMKDGRVALSQRVEWLTDAYCLSSAFMPMLTVQRLDPAAPERCLTDTLTFFDSEGREVATLDTTPYGAKPLEGAPCNFLGGTAATRVRAVGRESGLSVECGIAHRAGSPISDRTRISVWVRYGCDLDSKVYFDVSAGRSPRRGEVWEADVFYRISTPGHP